VIILNKVVVLSQVIVLTHRVVKVLNHKTVKLVVVVEAIKLKKAINLMMISRKHMTLKAMI
jgi:hypothetical protein